MARIFITGSADGLGRATATTLLGDGHDVIVHARSAQRLTAVRDLLDRGAAGVVGDLADAGHRSDREAAAARLSEQWHAPFRQFQERLLAALAEHTGTPLE
jgi:NAD(P)-dependent dehydrogenase (short-subunit alcohol dehydrogenase family)